MGCRGSRRIREAKWFAAGDEAMLPKNESSFASIDANQFGSTDLEISDSWVERELSAELPNSILPFAPMSAGFVHSPQWSPDWSTPGGHTHYRHPTTSTVQDSITPTSDTASPITSAKPSGPMNLVFLPIPPSSPDLSPPPPPPPSRQSITDSDDASSLGFASPSKDEASSRPAQPSSRPASSGIRSGKSSRDSSMSRRGDLRRAASIKAAVRRVLNDASEKGLYASNGATPDMGDMYDSDGASRRESADVASPTRTIVPEMGAKMWNTHPSPASPADTIVNDCQRNKKRFKFAIHQTTTTTNTSTTYTAIEILFLSQACGNPWILLQGSRQDVGLRIVPMPAVDMSSLERAMEAMQSCEKVCLGATHFTAIMMGSTSPQNQEMGCGCFKAVEKPVGISTTTGVVVTSSVDARASPSPSVSPSSSQSFTAFVFCCCCFAFVYTANQCQHLKLLYLLLRSYYPSSSSSFSYPSASSSSSSSSSCPGSTAFSTNPSSSSTITRTVALTHLHRTPCPAPVPQTDEDSDRLDDDDEEELDRRSFLCRNVITLALTSGLVESRECVPCNAFEICGVMPQGSNLVSAMFLIPVGSIAPTSTGCFSNSSTAPPNEPIPSSSLTPSVPSTSLSTTQSIGATELSVPGSSAGVFGQTTFGKSTLHEEFKPGDRIGTVVGIWVAVLSLSSVSLLARMRYGEGTVVVVHHLNLLHVSQQPALQALHRILGKSDGVLEMDIDGLTRINSAVTAGESGRRESVQRQDSESSMREGTSLLSGRGNNVSSLWTFRSPTPKR
ncbi:hypothetical protein BC829DRAFT_493340 [Chytridium lagenaria]|nr:hypothetical protein BC829DRAFT_493340 [Chytridium lagenaria]